MKVLLTGGYHDGAIIDVSGEVFISGSVRMAKPKKHQPRFNDGGGSPDIYNIKVEHTEYKYEGRLSQAGIPMFVGPDIYSGGA